jgi:hypothetical protein
MAAENPTPTENPKTQTIRKILDHEGPRITLLWVPSHKGIPGNEKADQAAKTTLDEDIATTEKWLTEKDFKKSDQRWKNGNNEMKERNPDVDRKEDTKGMPRKEQVAIARLKTGYTRAIHVPKMEGVSNPLCPFCNTYPSTTYCGNAKKLSTQRMNMDIRKEQWINGKTGMGKIIGYVFFGIY